MRYIGRYIGEHPAESTPSEPSSGGGALKLTEGFIAAPQDLYGDGASPPYEDVTIYEGSIS